MAAITNFGHKEYLGDAVYADITADREYVVLTTENGESATNVIYLEPSVVVALRGYLRKHCPNLILPGMDGT